MSFRLGGGMCRLPRAGLWLGDMERAAMNSILRLAAVATLVVPVAVHAAPTAPTAAEIGPAPSFADAVRIGEAELRNRLIDPDSAHIEWPYNFIGGSLKSMFSKRRSGFFTCGFVNAKNRMGGFTGKSWFLIMENAGTVTELDIGEADEIDAATISCNDFVKHESLPPSPASVTASPSPSPVTTFEGFQRASDASAAAAALSGGLGISFLPTPAGAVIVAVAKNSVAEEAGFRPGQVIQSVNGIDLRGMPVPAAIAVIRGLPKNSTFVMAGAGSIKVSRP